MSHRCLRKPKASEFPQELTQLHRRRCESPGVTDAINTPPPDRPPPLALHSLLHRLHRFSAPDPPVSTPPLFPTISKDPDRARNVAGTLCQGIRYRFSRARAAIRVSLKVSMGASRAIGVCKSVSCVSAISHWYSSYTLSTLARSLLRSFSSPVLPALIACLIK